MQLDVDVSPLAFIMTLRPWMALGHVVSLFSGQQLCTVARGNGKGYRDMNYCPVNFCLV